MESINNSRIAETGEMLLAQAALHKDFVAPTHSLRAIVTQGTVPALVIPGHEPFDITEHAHGQMADFAGIPRSYYDRIRRHAPELYTANVNTWLARAPGRRLVRTLGGQVRAFLSDKYRPLDNLDLFQAVLPVLQEEEFRLQALELTETRFYMKLVLPRVEGEVKPGDWVQAGLIVRNSEVGAGSLAVEPFAYFLACHNGLILPEANLRKTHIGRAYMVAEDYCFLRTQTQTVIDAGFWLTVQDLLKGAIDEANFSGQVRKLRESTSDQFEAEVYEVVEATGSKFRFTKEEQKSILESLLNGHAGEVQFSRYGLLQAITDAAKDASDYERQIELEQAAGKLLEMPRPQWERIAQAAS